MSFDDGVNRNTFLGEEQFAEFLTPLHQVNPESHSSDDILHSINPLFLCDQCQFKTENNILRCEAPYWKGMHQKAKDREEKLIQENKHLQARVKQLEHMLFAQSSEKDAAKPDESGSKKKPGRKRGQQKDAPGHGRRRHPNLPVHEEPYDLPEDEKCCPCCHLPYLPFLGTEDSDVLEIEVSAHIRRIKRKRYKRACTCENLPAVITAKGPDKLIPGSVYGDSIWIEVLIDKYHSWRPAYRLIKNMELIDLDIPQGTITDGLRRLEPFFKPVYEQIMIQSRTESHFHADETRWEVFCRTEGKIGYRWYMWVFKSKTTVAYILDQSRSSKVPAKHLKNLTGIILSADRYAAYKVIAKDGSIILSFCRAHVRRDFITAGKGCSSPEQWAIDWVLDIGTLYHLNDARLSTKPGCPERDQSQARLEKAVEDFAKKCDAQLQSGSLHPACEKVLKSLKNHWNGLTVFVRYPQVPMDNNTAEQQLRGLAAGRKNFYGSGALWSAELTAAMFSIFRTLALWDINPKTWLQSYLKACAENGSKAPGDLSPFLPWTMEEARRQSLQLPPSFYDTG